MLSISSGYDWRYLVDQVGAGAENYYLAGVEISGEPPGVWAGRGLEALGLEAGAEVSAEQMEALYGMQVHPGTGQLLGRPARVFASAKERLDAALAAEPGATPERQVAIGLEVRKAQRAAVHFFDATFSPAKSVSVLWASAARQAADAGVAAGAAEAAGDLTEGERLRGLEAQWRGVAEQVWAGVEAGNSAMLEYLQDEAGYSRAGYHGRTADGGSSGRWLDAHEWATASFHHHISREGDPQLHIHNAIVNRVLCADPAKAGVAAQWRTLDSRGMYRARAGAGAVAERVMEEHLTRALGVEFVMRPDGKAREIAGIGAEVRDAFSTRRAAIRRQVADLAGAYEAQHGRAPSAYVLSKISLMVTLDSRPDKSRDVPTRLEQLDAWETKLNHEAGATLRGVAVGALGRVEVGGLVELDASGAAVAGAEAAPAAGVEAGAAEPGGVFDPGAVIAAAVNDAAASKSVWNRHDLVRALNAHLPDCLGGLDAVAVRDLLGELADQATTGGGHGVVRLDAPAVVVTPASLCLANGASAYEAAGVARFASVAALAREEQLAAATRRQGAPALDAARAGELLTDLAGAGLSLGEDQAVAVTGILTSGRAVEVLIGPAGTGKSRAVGALTKAWEAEHGPVLGLALSQTAAEVLAAEGMTKTHNITEFLACVEDGTIHLAAGQLVVVDEAGMAPTARLARIEEITRAAGAKLLLVGDDHQLAAVGAGGGLRLLAQELGRECDTGGVYELTTVRRFAAEWERDASLQLRAGQVGVLAAYDRHGRLVEGTREDMAAAARAAWVAGHLDGKRPLLTVSSNEEAAVLSAAVREDLIALGLVEPGGVPLGHADGVGTVAGVGDLIATRANDRSLTEAAAGNGAGAGHFVTNRDVWRVEGRAADGALRVARQLEHGVWGPALTLPADYVASSVTLAYASTVHGAQGRTVDISHCLIDGRVDAAALYVAMTRGRYANIAYCVTRVADVEAELDPAAPGAVMDRSEVVQVDRLSLLAGILENTDPERSATEVLRAELAGADALDRLGPIWADVIGVGAGPRYEALLAEVLDEATAAEVAGDEAAGTLWRLVAGAEAAGHDPVALLATAVQARGFGDAESVAKVLHYRIERLVGSSVTAPTGARSFTAQTPPAAAWPGEVGDFARDLAAVMDARVTALGEDQAAHPAPWALARLGPVPHDPIAAAEWSRRAGAVAAYREQHGHTYGTGPDGQALDERDAIGAAPPVGARSARAAWFTAHAALDPDGAARDYATMPTEALRALQRAYDREEAWAPAYVAEELREVSLSARATAEAATLARAEIEAAARGGQPLDAALTARSAQAERLAELAARLEEERRELAEIDAARAAWHVETTGARAEAEAATVELAHRGLTDSPSAAPTEVAPIEEPQVLDEATRAAGDGQLDPGQLDPGQLDRGHRLEDRDVALDEARDHTAAPAPEVLDAAARERERARNRDAARAAQDRLTRRAAARETFGTEQAAEHEAAERSAARREAARAAARAAGRDAEPELSRTTARTGRAQLDLRQENLRRAERGRDLDVDVTPDLDLGHDLGPDL